MESDEVRRGTFVIDGESVPFPDFEEGWTLDEGMVFYEYVGIALEELTSNPEDEENADPDEQDEMDRKRRSPAVIAALMHIGYSRAHPNAKTSNIRRIVKSANYVDAMKNLLEASEVKDGPPAQKTPEQPDSDESLSVEKPSSGDGSTNGSDEPDGTPEPTGTTRSDTSLDLDRLTLAQFNRGT